jgi:2-polyprenyl-6-methoxyphenol hydroxylase-like FAD-dependent oxidoreductase
MTSIGIVGAGVAGLHLGLQLRAADVPVTLYTDSGPDELASGRLTNTVTHHHPTLERERVLGVHHWDAAEYGYGSHHHVVGRRLLNGRALGGPDPLVFRGDLTDASSAIDHRIYLPRLLADFAERGGRCEVRGVGAGDLESLGERHDLLVVASGRGALAGLFPLRPERSPYDRPQRRLSVALWHGVEPAEPKGVTLSIAPGVGELLELPMYSFSGHVTALLFEIMPGGGLEALWNLRYDDDPRAYERAGLAALAEHFPRTFERVDPASFAVTRPQDVLQGALIPHMRADYACLGNGTYALAAGDVHCVVDPMMGQGANSASYSAWAVGEAILEELGGGGLGFDELFCRRAARRRAEVVEATADWTNLMLGPPPPHLLALLEAMSQHQGLADEFTHNFGHPDRQWAVLATPRRTARYLAAHGLDMADLLA